MVDIRSGRLVGAEVLARWRKPDGSLVLPGSFIPLAELSGLIIDITRRLMRQVCADVGPAIGQRPGFKIGFNFTAMLFSNRNIIRDLRSIFAGSPIALSQVVLELTEREPIDDLTETRQVIAALQGIGVRIAIDDVGTGHSGLSYMLKLGVDIIKIDKMFVDALGSDSKGRSPSSRRWSISPATCAWTSSRRGSRISSRSRICARSASARRRASCSRRRCPARRS